MRSPLVLLLLAQLAAHVFGGVVNDCRVPSGDSGEIRGLWNLTEPFGIYLSPIYNGSFAHITMKERMPAILQTIIDAVNRDIEEIVEKHGADAREEAPRVVANLKVLKNELLRNAPLTNLTLAHSAADRDAKEWNDQLARRRELEGPNLSYFLSQFLLAESYTFRRAAQEFALTQNLKTYDFFGKQKQRLLTNSATSLPLLARHAMTLVNKPRAGMMSDDEAREELSKLLKLSLWGNRFDLAVSSGGDISQEGDPLELLASFDKDLLVDQARVAWDVLRAPRAADEPAIVDIVMDNSGYELFNDLCLAAVLVSRGLATTVRFHAKQIPWYVSDVNIHDFHWVIGYMRGSSNADLREFGDFCALQLERGSWTIEADPFWTTFHGFGAMKKEAPALYKKLSEARLVIFKGDLNYRKLVNDINWENTISLDTALFHLDFKPTNVLSLRTVKSLPCVGLTLEKVRLWKADKKKMGDGTYGVINASTKNAKCNCADNR